MQKYLDVEINRKIVRFFLENPSSIDTSRGIATWINEDAAKTESALHDLAKAKILVLHQTALTSAYACTPDKKTISKIRLHLERKYKTPN
ncbi:MAG: hypothetical protein PHI59_06505 [Candidatus Omnitrophica bacterium]|nr:hypothetical protein [Candidatus Omnitrophota bacterium]